MRRKARWHFAILKFPATIRISAFSGGMAAASTEPDLMTNTEPNSTIASEVHHSKENFSVGSLSFGAIIVLASTILLLETEVLATAVSAVWALTELSGFGLMGDIVFGLLILPAVAWAIWIIIRLSISHAFDSDI
jgi:uncharacterized membrane protein